MLPWAAHLYTACGAVLALVAVRQLFADDVRGALLALAAATVVDATDGVLARALRVGERLPRFDGARLDDIVDYLTYVFVPVVLVWRTGLLPPAWELPVLSVVLLSSAYGFGQADAKNERADWAFTGFPSYWNLVALYLYVWRLPPAANAAILLALAGLVFVPIGYVYPSRTRTLRAPTLAWSAVWAVSTTVMIWRLPATDGPWMGVSLSFVVYYFALSWWLHAQPARRPNS